MSKVLSFSSARNRDPEELNTRRAANLMHQAASLLCGCGDEDQEKVAWILEDCVSLLEGKKRKARSRLLNGGA